MLLSRSCGVLLHPVSLPGGHGIGDFGAGARRFLDYLRAARQGLWQILPLGPVNGSSSPYQTLSSFAGNPLLISLDLLAAAGLLSADDLRGAPANNEAFVDYPAVREFKEARLRRAFAGGCKNGAYSEAAFQEFRKKHSAWLEDFSLFMALRSQFNGAAWWQWPEKPLVRREAKALKEWREKLAGECAFHEWVQFVFFAQWTALKKEANDSGIKIIGDIPIYPAHDSADVWAAPGQFALDAETGAAEVMAGCPPDYFSEDGQLWGNPVYRWDKMKADGYQWWRRRLEIALSQADILRLDHFRGFESFWAVPAGEKTARNGHWEKGPGDDFFRAMKKAFGVDLPLIAEDLGVITPEVNALRDGNALPGMKILQFAFCDGANAYRPHTYDKNCAVYTGTHDNDTTRGWYAAAGDDYAHMGRDVLDRERDFARRYLAVDGSNIHWDMIRLAIASPANTAVFPMQDILGLGNDCRMNRPGTAEGNWAWRLTTAQLEHAEVNYLRDLTEIFDRAR